MIFGGGFRPLVMAIDICSYHLIKNILCMIRYRPACNGGR